MPIKTLHLIQELSKSIRLNALSSDYKSKTLLIVNNSNNNGKMFASTAHSSHDYKFPRDKDHVLFIFIPPHPKLPALVPECSPDLVHSEN